MALEVYTTNTINLEGAKPTALELLRLEEEVDSTMNLCKINPDNILGINTEIDPQRCIGYTIIWAKKDEHGN